MKNFLVVSVILPVTLIALKVIALKVIVDGDNGDDCYKCLNDQDSKPCGSLEYIASKLNQKDNITINITSASLTVNKTNFVNFNHLIIAGRGMNITSINCTINEDGYPVGGLVFSNSNNISLLDFTITKCGLIFNSQNYSFKQAILFHNCSRLNISQVMFSRNTGYGLTIHRSGNASIVNCFIEHNYCHSKIPGGGISVYLEGQQYQHIHISCCKFNSNFADCEMPSIYSANIGGGIRVKVLDQNISSVLISNSTFINNSAVSGGGIYVLIGQTSSRNNISVQGCRFLKNKSMNYSGGAIDIYLSVFKKHAKSNRLFISNCTFTENKAVIGGAVGIWSPKCDNASHKKLNYITFDNCLFKENVANVSAAVDVNHKSQKSYGDTFITKVYFKNCQFIGNKVEEGKTRWSKVHTNKRIVFTVDIDITFEGSKTSFRDNCGTALYIVSTNVRFASQSVTVFENNTGHHGGAILLIDNAVLHVDNAKLRFISNSAIIGGALCILPNSAYYKGECFFHLTCHNKSSCKKISAMFEFNDNKATTGIGNDMFVSSFEDCCKRFKVNATHLLEHSYLGKFNFTYSINDSVSTAISTLKLRDGVTHFIPYPGIPYSMKLLQLDELENDVNHFFTLSASLLKNHNTSVTVDSGYATLSDTTIIFHGCVNDDATLVLQSTDMTDISLEVNVSLSCCPPGYFFLNGSCICSHSVVQEFYHGVSNCLSNHSAMIINGHWAGYIDNYQFVTAQCPMSLCSYPYSRKTYGENYLPLNFTKLNEHVCHNNREGILCGHCKTSHTTYYHSPSFKCGKTTNCHYGFLWYIFSEILPVTGIFLFIVLFNINLTSGDLYSIIFYAQILNNQFTNFYLMVSMKGLFSIVFNTYKSIYGIFGLEVFEIDHLSYCIMNDATVMDILMLKYLSTIYALLLIVATIAALKVNTLYTCIKICHKFGRRNVYESIINGITAFLILCYFRSLMITMQILFPSTINGLSTSKFTKIVPLYNGNLQFLSGKHLKYAIPAFACIFFIILPPPVILLSEPLLLRLNVHFKRRYFLFYCCHRLRMNLKLFLDSFQGCFKDKCRIFAGLFFVYRILIVIGNYMNNLLWNIFFQCGILFGILLLHSLCHPFQNNKHNHLDIFLLVNILIVNFLAVFSSLISLHELFDEVNDHVIGVIFEILLIILISLPLFCLLCNKFCRSSYKRENFEEEDSLPHRLSNYSAYYGSIQNKTY